MRARIAAEGTPVLGLHLLIGPTAREQMARLLGCLEQGLLAPVEMIAALPICSAGLGLQSRRLVVGVCGDFRARGETMDDITGLREKYLTAIAAAADEAGLEEVRLAALGKKGEVSGLMRGLGAMTPEERQTAGPALNALKDDLDRRARRGARPARRRGARRRGSPANGPT